MQGLHFRQFLVTVSLAWTIILSFLHLLLYSSNITNMMWLVCMLFDVTVSYILPVVLLVQFVRFCLADGDLTLLYKERFGQPISSLNGKVVWITGASSGIGEYFAYDLARNCKNIRLILSARRQNELQRVKQVCVG